MQACSCVGTEQHSWSPRTQAALAGRAPDAARRMLHVGGQARVELGHPRLEGLGGERGQVRARVAKAHVQESHAGLPWHAPVILPCVLMLSADTPQYWAPGRQTSSS